MMELAALTLTSLDLERSRTFYATKLGFDVIAENEHSFVVVAGGIKLVVSKDGARQPLHAAEPRLVFRTHKLADRCRELRDRGVSVDGPVRGRAELADPDGHPINLVESES